MNEKSEDPINLTNHWRKSPVWKSMDFKGFFVSYGPLIVLCVISMAKGKRDATPVNHNWG